MYSNVLKSDGEEMGKDVDEVGREAHETRGEVWQPCEGIGVGSGWDGPKPEEAWAAANGTAIKASLGKSAVYCRLKLHPARRAPDGQT